jgi:hypothetical protein
VYPSYYGVRDAATINPAAHAKAHPSRRGPLEERLWSRVAFGSNDECWEWQGPVNSSGYGGIQMGSYTVGVHVAAFLLMFGSVAPGNQVCHHCDNPRCCNPLHMFEGTQRDNMLDAAAKGRNGSQLYPERRPRGDRHFSRRNPELLARGERANAGKGKLSRLQVIEIRDRYAAGGVTQQALGIEFQVSQTQIGRIVRGDRWGWLKDERIRP